jgi:hypothetical protein
MRSCQGASQAVDMAPTVVGQDQTCTALQEAAGPVVYRTNWASNWSLGFTTGFFLVDLAYISTHPGLVSAAPF